MGEEIMSEPIVVDEYIEAVAEFFRAQGNRYSEALEAYVKTMQEINREGIIAGETANALAVFISQAEQLVNGIGEVSRQACVGAITFLEDVDESDEFLY